jgi:hypothetical protein
VLSMEYLCAESEVKRNSLGISIGKTIVALGAMLADNKGFDGALGTPIKSIKGDLMMENVGGKFIQSDFSKYGYRVDLLFIPTKPCERSRDISVGKIADHLWLSRQDHSIEFFGKMAA